MKPRRVYTLSTNNKNHQIFRAAFRPPNYICETLNDLKIAIDPKTPAPHVLVIDLLTYNKKFIIDFLSRYIESNPDVLVILLGHESDLELLRQFPRRNIFDLLTSPITLKKAIFLADRLDMIFSLREQIHRQEEERKRIIDKLPLPLIVVSDSLTISCINSPAAQLFSLQKTPKERKDMDIGDLVEKIAPQDRPIFAEALRRAFSAGLTSKIKLEIINKENKSGLVSFSIFPVLQDPGFQKESEVFVVVDYEEMLAREQVDIFQKEKLAVLGELSAEIAHEIRNSLMSISGFVQIMRPEDQKKGKQTILAEVKRLERFLTSIREYSRPAMDVCEIDLKKLIISIMELMTPELKRNGISYRISFHKEPVIITTAPDILKQVIINLIRNACEAMPEGGMLEVATFESRGKIALSISDQGTGIEEPQEKLFVPISRGGKSIGLPISHKLITQLGGSIELISSKHGTTFTLYIPRNYSQFQIQSRKSKMPTTHTESKYHPERRSNQRFEVFLKGSCVIKDRQIGVDVINLSKTGILLKIASETASVGELRSVSFDVSSIHTGDTKRICASITPVHRYRKNGDTFVGCRMEPEKESITHWERYIRELQLYHPTGATWQKIC